MVMFTGSAAEIFGSTNSLFVDGRVTFENLFSIFVLILPFLRRFCVDYDCLIGLCVLILN